MEKLNIFRIINQSNDLPSSERFEIFSNIKKSSRLGRSIIFNTKYKPIIDPLTSFIPQTINENGNKVVDLYYFTEIYKNNTLTINHQQIRQVQEDYKGKAISLLIVNEINKGTSQALSYIQPQINNTQYTTTNFSEHLSDDLVMISSFAKLMDALKHPEVSGVISDAVKELILNDRVGALISSELYHNYYEQLSPLFEDDKLELLRWITNNWDISKRKSLEEFAPTLIKDSAEHKFTEINNALIELYEEQYETKNWEDSFTNTTDLDRYEAQIFLASETQRKKSKFITDAFKELLKQNSLNSNSMTFFKLIVKTLPIRAVSMIKKYMSTSFFNDGLNNSSRDLIVDFALNTEDSFFDINSVLNDKEQKILCDFINSSPSNESIEWLSDNLIDIGYWTEDNKSNLKTVIEGNELNSSFQEVLEHIDKHSLEKM